MNQEYTILPFPWKDQKQHNVLMTVDGNGGARAVFVADPSSTLKTDIERIQDSVDPAIIAFLRSAGAVGFQVVHRYPGVIIIHVLYSWADMDDDYEHFKDIRCLTVGSQEEVPVTIDPNRG